MKRWNKQTQHIKGTKLNLEDGYSPVIETEGVLNWKGTAGKMVWPNSTSNQKKFFNEEALMGKCAHVAFQSTWNRNKLLTLSYENVFRLNVKQILEATSLQKSTQRKELHSFHSISSSYTEKKVRKLKLNTHVAAVANYNQHLFGLNKKLNEWKTLKKNKKHSSCQIYANNRIKRSENLLQTQFEQTFRAHECCQDLTPV